MGILGELLQKEIHSRGVSQKTFAEAIGISPSHLSEVIKGKRKIPNALIPQVAAFIGVPIDQVKECQKGSKNPTQSKQIVSEEDARAEEILKAYDEVVSVRSLLKSLNMERKAHAYQLAALVKQYDLSEPHALSQNLQTLKNRCFRRSAKTGMDHRMIYTWVLKARKEVKECVPAVAYNKCKNEELAEQLCAVFHRNEDTFANVRKLLADYGIGFAIVEKEEHASIDGYSFYKEGHPFIVITNRYKRIDNLAFTIMHEHGHIALGHTNPNESMINVDERLWSLDSDEVRAEKELEADKYATNHLIPENIWCITPKVPMNPYIIQTVFMKWANEHQLNEWIVLGRVSYETGMYRFKSNKRRQIN